MRSQLWMSSSSGGDQKSLNFSRASSTVMFQEEPPSVRKRTRPSLAYWEKPFRKRRNSSLLLEPFFPSGRGRLLCLESHGMQDGVKLFQGNGGGQFFRA